MENTLKQLGWGIASLVFFVVPYLSLGLINKYVYNLEEIIKPAVLPEWIVLIGMSVGLICGFIGLNRYGFEKFLAVIGVILNGGAIILYSLYV